MFNFFCKILQHPKINPGSAPVLRQFSLAGILAILLISRHPKKYSIGFSEETISKRLFFTLPEKDIKPNSNKNLLISFKNDFFTMWLLSYIKKDSLKNIVGCFFKTFSTPFVCGSIKSFSFISDVSIPALKMSFVGFIKFDCYFLR